MFQVKEISKLLGVDRSFLHYYDEIGIIVPKKNDKRYRSYNENDLIALASSKYYRAMNMPLKSISEIILTSNLNEKLEIMEAQKENLLYQSELCKDLATLSEAAIQTYQTAYQNDIQENQVLQAFEFIPVLHQGKYDDQLISSDEMKELLNFFPFVSYAYYFSEGSLTNPKQFDYSLGLSVIPYFRKKYHHSLPSQAIQKAQANCIVYPLTKDMEQNGLSYEEFENVRQYAQIHHFKLTGEALAYCVFSNYEHDQAQIKLVVYLITK